MVFRVTENAFHWPALVTAKELIAAGRIGTPTMIRIKTVVGRTDSEFQNTLEPEGYIWRFNDQSPGGHLFDDVVHKYATALWLTDDDIRSVQAVVRRGPLFFEAPTAAIWECGRDDLLRSDNFGADEFFEIQGTDGHVWVTCLTGHLLDLPAVMLYEADGTQTNFPVDTHYDVSFANASKHFVDSLLAGTEPDMSGELAVKVLQLCFAVYQASIERGPVDPATIDIAVSPPWWPPSPELLMQEAMEMGENLRKRA